MANTKKEITNSGNAGQVNAYTCGNGCDNTIIKHRDAGTTPMYIDCFTCNTRAVSHMYEVPQNLEPQLIAFAPKNKAEWKTYRRYVAECWQAESRNWTMAELWDAMGAVERHIRAGGLVMMPKEKLSS